MFMPRIEKLNESPSTGTSDNADWKTKSDASARKTASEERRPLTPARSQYPGRVRPSWGWALGSESREASDERGQLLAHWFVDQLAVLAEDFCSP